MIPAHLPTELHLEDDLMPQAGVTECRLGPGAGLRRPRIPKSAFFACMNVEDDSKLATPVEPVEGAALLVSGSRLDGYFSGGSSRPPHATNRASDALRDGRSEAAVPCMPVPPEASPQRSLWSTSATGDSEAQCSPSAPSCTCSGATGRTYSVEDLNLGVNARCTPFRFI